MKILHSADWHLCSPLLGRSEAQTQLLRKNLLLLPGKIAALCRKEQCDMMLLSGDLFDGPFDADTFRILCDALKEAAVPVFITPGNHDFADMASPWLTQKLPENVHIFTRPVIEAVEVPSLHCRVYGAGFNAMDCPPLLEGFRADTDMTAIGILHGDPAQAASPYNPITRQQVEDSGLAYLALGHIHKGGAFRAGGTLCAWPGCPMGRGYDETGEKGVLIVTLDDTAETRFVGLGMPEFFDLECAPRELDALLPPVGNENIYRITLTGESEPPDMAALAEKYARFPHLELRDKTVPPLDVWRSLGEDSFEGTYFGILHKALENADPETESRIQLAARICRQILDGQEVTLP